MNHLYIRPLCSISPPTNHAFPSLFSLQITLDFGGCTLVRVKIAVVQLDLFPFFTDLSFSSRSIFALL